MRFIIKFFLLFVSVTGPLKLAFSYNTFVCGLAIKTVLNSSPRGLLGRMSERVNFEIIHARIAELSKSEVWKDVLEIQVHRLDPSDYYSNQWTQTLGTLWESWTERWTTAVVYPMGLDAFYRRKKEIEKNVLDSISSKARKGGDTWLFSTYVELEKALIRRNRIGNESETISDILGVLYQKQKDASQVNWPRLSSREVRALFENIFISEPRLLDLVLLENLSTLDTTLRQMTDFAHDSKQAARAIIIVAAMVAAANYANQHDEF